MNKIIINGVEMHNAEIVINTNESPVHSADSPPAGGGPGGEPPPPPPKDK